MIVRTVMIEMSCDESDCESCFELAGPDMAIFRLRQLAKERGWYSKSRTNGTSTIDYCPEHRRDR